MKLFLIRHGQSKGNIKPGFISGRTDPEGLTNTGKVQVIRTAYALRNEAIDHIIVSPVARAQETSHILHHYFPQATIKTEEWLSELHHGVFENHYWWEVIHHISPQWRKYRDDVDKSIPGGGESIINAGKRIYDGIKSLQAQYQGKTIALISHQGPIAAGMLVRDFEFEPNLQKNKAEVKVRYQKYRVSNAEYIKLTVSKKNGKKTTICTEMGNMHPSDETIKFYAQGLLNKNIDTIQSIITSSKNDNYVISTSQPSEKYLMKFLKDNSVNNINRIISLYSYLEKKNISSVKILFTDVSKKYFKDSVQLHYFTKGKSMLSFIHKSIKEDLLKDVFDYMQKVYSLPVPEVKQFWYREDDVFPRNWKSYMIGNINVSIHFISSWCDNTKIEEKLKAILKELKNNIRQESNKLVPIHGDLNPSNILLSSDGKYFQKIIDFELTKIGDRVWDFAHLLGWFDQQSSDVAKKWMRLLEKKLSGSDQQLVQKYRLLFHAWTLRSSIENPKDPVLLKNSAESKKIILSLISIL